MGSGVAETDELVRDDANNLLNAGVSYAKRMLRKYGEFGPFGYRLNDEGEPVMERIAQQKMPAEPALLLSLRLQQLSEKARRGGLFATAMASNVTMAKASDEGYSDAIMI